MEHKGVDVIDVIARRVKELRNRSGYTAEQLASKLNDEGVPWERATVTKLETGRRQNVTAGELLALAKVLNVSLVNLLVPLEDGQPYNVTPKTTVDAKSARAWIRGSRPLPDMDVRVFRTEVPLQELSGKRDFFERMASWKGQDGEPSVDLDTVRRLNPELWEDGDGEGR
ncbi:hypothetical protein AN219_37745 [Streptomyces nanshensis]|nr:hypothetical protein AN219_37745 [Streptomyces nanshensis]